MNIGRTPVIGMAALFLALPLAGNASASQVADSRGVAATTLIDFMRVPGHGELLFGPEIPTPEHAAAVVGAYLARQGIVEDAGGAGLLASVHNILRRRRQLAQERWSKEAQSAAIKRVSSAWRAVQAAEHSYFRERAMSHEEFGQLLQKNYQKVQDIYGVYGHQLGSPGLAMRYIKRAQALLRADVEVRQRRQEQEIDALAGQLERIAVMPGAAAQEQQAPAAQRGMTGALRRQRIHQPRHRPYPSHRSSNLCSGGREVA